ncbi:BolA family protein [Thiosulfativibrio zosterae]|uniref:BolA family transcriptional regulator n=1 Tax=Thiosulfativibrio zosterae TaxID=2675053 RepID=A0A6F8PMJ5_9GAMM|nr:BolA/IbaG family iron-sulfur metabolism protein [Thiosulfativibrio zosterae]BBP43220.1 BolA family transcriptional regulator [Thiosulfativibrio zosterae]
MSPELIQQKIIAHLPEAQVTMDGMDCNFAVEVVCACFEGKSPIQRHRMVNDIFKDDFASGALHALSIKTRTP